MTLFPTPWRDRSPFPSSRRGDLLSNWIDQWFAQTGLEPAGDGSSALLPPINVAEDQKAMMVTVELPGFEEKDVQVNVTGNLVTISGERKWEDAKKGKEWHRVESRYGSFTRSLTLPSNLRTDQVDAVFSKGVLSLTFQKVEPTPTTKVKIKTQ